MPTMQRRHFNFIAKTIAEMPLSEGCRVEVACGFIAALKPTNSNLDEQRFYDACTAGVPAEPTPNKYEAFVRQLASDMYVTWEEECRDQGDDPEHTEKGADWLQCQDDALRRLILGARKLIA